MGPHVHDRARTARGRLRRAPAGDLAAPAAAVAARLRRHRLGVVRGARTSSPTCTGRPCSTTSSSPPPRSRSSPRKRARSSAARGAGSRSTRSTSRPRPRRSPSATPRSRCRAARCCASRSASTTRRSRAGCRSKAAVGPAISSRPRPTSRPRRPPRPDGFVGDLRSYQAEALAWLGFLDSVDLGGCLALDMGLGKTPTMLAHVLADKAAGPTLVIAPPAVVGNWLAEAERFTPKLPRGRAPRREPRVGRRPRGRSRRRRHGRDHLRNRRAGRRRDRRGRVGAPGARRGAGDQEPRQRDVAAAAQDRRAHRIALTGTPIENGLGDLWAILDFTNPGLVGPRPQFIARLSNDGTTTARRRRRRDRARSTASSCSAAPRPSPRSRPSSPTRSTSSTTAR